MPIGRVGDRAVEDAGVAAYRGKENRGGGEDRRGFHHTKHVRVDERAMDSGLGLPQFHRQSRGLDQAT